MTTGFFARFWQQGLPYLLPNSRTQCRAWLGILVICSFIAGFAPKLMAQEQTLEHALTALREDRKTDAINALQPLANNGNGVAQFWLLTAAILSGKNDSSYQTATRYLFQMKPQLQNLAEQNQAFAQFGLGLIYYLDGHSATPQFGLPKTSAELAANWFQKAANQGNEWGEYFLAICFQTGFGVSQNLENALKWAKSAQTHGLKLASPLQQTLIAAQTSKNFSRNANDIQEYFQRSLRAHSAGNGCAKYELLLGPDNYYYSYLTNCSQAPITAIWCTTVKLDSATAPDTLCRGGGQGGQRLLFKVNQKIRLATRPLLSANSDWSDQNQMNVFTNFYVVTCFTPAKPKVMNWEARQAKCLNPTQAE